MVSVSFVLRAGDFAAGGTDHAVPGHLPPSHQPGRLCTPTQDHGPQVSIAQTELWQSCGKVI